MVSPAKGYEQSPEQIAGEKFRFDRRYGQKLTDAQHAQMAMDGLARDRQAYLKAGGRASLLHRTPGVGEHMATADFLAAQQQIHDLHHSLDPEGAKAYYAPKQGPTQNGATLDAQAGAPAPAARSRITPSSASSQVPKWVSDHAGSAAERAVGASTPSVGVGKNTQVDIVAKQNAPGMRPGAEAVIRPNQPSAGPRSIGRVMSQAEGDAFIGANGKALGPADGTNVAATAGTGKITQTPFGPVSSRSIDPTLRGNEPAPIAGSPTTSAPLRTAGGVTVGSNANDAEGTPTPPLTGMQKLKDALIGTVDVSPSKPSPYKAPAPFNYVGSSGIPAATGVIPSASRPSPPQIAPAAPPPPPVATTPSSPAPTPTAAISPQTGLPLSKMSTSAIATRTAPEETEEQRLKRIGGATLPARQPWMTA